MKNEIIKEISQIESELKRIDKTDIEYYGKKLFNLGLLYLKLSKRENKEKNLDLSIKAFNYTLKIFNKDNYPYKYSSAKINLGNAYNSLSEIKDKEKNLKLAINASYEALNFFSKNNYPDYYSLIEANLADSYNSLSKIRDKEVNLKLAINASNNALNIFSKDNSPHNYAITQMNLGGSYNSLSKIRDKEVNLKLAINASYEALNFFSKNNYSDYYSGVQINLGNSYNSLSEIRDKEKNLKFAIDCYNKALKVFNKNDFPYDYALTQMNLGNSYNFLSEIRDKEVNLKLAINASNKALIVFNKNDFTYDYALTQMNLGNSYNFLSEIRDKEVNLKLAINTSNNALIFFNKDNFSYDYALTQMNLGNSYNFLSETRDKEVNLKLAINAFNKALEVINKNNFPYNYALTQINLGNSFNFLSKIRDKEVNLILAINAFNKALEVFNKNDFPYNYALTKVNLGNSYNSLSEIRDKEVNLILAIDVFNKALEVFTKDNFPYNYALTKVNLGNSYNSLSEIRYKEVNLILAIDVSSEALIFFSKNNYPYNYALTQINLGNAYYFLSKIKYKEKNIKLSINAFNNALKVINKNNYPYNYALTQINLGNAYYFLSKIKYKEKNIKLAISLYKNAIECFYGGYNKIESYLSLSRLLINEYRYFEAYNTLLEAIEWIEKTRIGLINPNSKEDWSSACKEIYFNMIYTCVQFIKSTKDNDKKSELFKYIEMSKTRNLIDILSSKSSGRIVFDEALAVDNIELLNELKLLNKNDEELVKVRAYIDSLSSNNNFNLIKKEINQDEFKLKVKEEELLLSKQKEIFNSLYEHEEIKARLSEVNGEVIPFSDLQSLLKEKNFLDTAIVQYYLSDDLFVMNLITDNEIKSIFKEGQEVKELNNLLDIYYDCFKIFERIDLKSDDYKNDVKEIYIKYPSLKEIFPNSSTDEFIEHLLNYLGNQFYHYLYEPLEIPNKFNKVMFISHTRLHNFAFNILKKENTYLIEEKMFYKLPSASIWTTLKNKKLEEFNNITAFAVLEYPNGKLNLDEQIKNLDFCFDEKDINKIINEKVQPNTIKEKMIDSNIMLLIGHGYANKEDSGYKYLSNNGEVSKLSISTIFSSFPSFKDNSLVILEICHGAYQIIRGDEINAMNSVFLMLGAGGIISNIIELRDDFANAFFNNFYDKLASEIEANKQRKKLASEIYFDKQKNKLEIFYDCLRKHIKEKANRWVFLEFQGNPNL